MSVEELKNELNKEIRNVLAIIDLIDGKTKEYFDYEENTMNEEEYLRKQLELVKEAKERLVSIFKY